MKSKRYIFFLWICLTSCSYIWANMANPKVFLHRAASRSHSPYSSKNIDILHEKIYLDAKNNTYKVTYKIYSPQSGMQIPLIFNSLNFNKNFKLTLDNQEIRVSNLEHQDTLKRVLKQFSTNAEDEILKIDSTYSGRNLIYFEVNLSEGEHIIEAIYETSSGFKPNGNWKRYFFAYSLAPAKHWKSFGTLEITFDSSDDFDFVDSDLGEPTSQNNNLTTWYFDNLPRDEFTIYCDPDLNIFQYFIGFVRSYYFFFLSAFIIYYHVLRYKKRVLRGKSIEWVFATAWTTFLLLFGSMQLPSFLSTEHSLYHYSYYGFGIFLMPIFFLILDFIYGMIAYWVYNTFYKKKLKMNQSSNSE